MKKKSIILLFSILFLSQYFALAQNKNGKAIYDIRLAEDILFFEGTLYFNDHESLFRYKDHPKNRWERFEGEGLAQVIYTDNIGQLLKKEYGKSFYEIRTFCKKKPILFNDNVLIEWELGNEQKMIGDLLCKNATTKFRGRTYIAWYATSIPVNTGPWKFHGLPGLIIEVNDKEGLVNISLKNLVSNDNSFYNFKFDESSKISLKNYLKCKEEEWEDKVTKDQANIAKLRAKFPDLELEVSHDKNKGTTELEYE